MIFDSSRKIEEVFKQMRQARGGKTRQAPGKRAEREERAIVKQRIAPEIAREKTWETKIPAVSGRTVLRIIADQSGAVYEPPGNAQPARTDTALPAAEGIGRKSGIDAEQRARDGIFKDTDSARAAKALQQYPKAKQ